MDFAFGRYGLRANGDDVLTERLKSWWRDYADAAPRETPDAALTFRRVASLDVPACEQGWRCEIRPYGRRRASYFSGARALFAVEYGAHAGEAEVLVAEASDAAIRLGAQYGLMLALRDRCVGLHGATVRCGCETVILSAPSGTGKSTLAGLLEAYCGAQTLNGDFALLSADGDGAAFEPTPFCGTSGICTDRRARIDRVVFLAQAPTDQWRELNGREALVRFMSNVFVPDWDAAAALCIQSTVMSALKHISVSAFAFAPTAEAARMLHDHTDSEGHTSHDQKEEST